MLCGQELADPALMQIGLIIVRLARIQEPLKLSKHRDPNLRTFGIVWVLLAPLLLIMAAMSTVRSDVTYRVQLSAFSLVAVVSLILGVAGICRLRWAAAGLRVLSILGLPTSSAQRSGARLATCARFSGGVRCRAST